MYSHLLVGHKDKDISFGPTAVTFRWKAGKPKTEEVDKIYSRFGYANSMAPNKNDREINERGKIQRFQGLSDKWTRRNQRPILNGQTPWRMRMEKPVSLENKYKPKKANSASVYSQSLGGKSFRASRVSNLNSASPFTPPPPDGDPAMLRIFPIYEKNPSRSFAQTEQRTLKSAETLPNPANLYTPDSFFSTSRAPRQNPRQPKWLQTALNQKRKQLEAFRRMYTSGAGLAGRDKTKCDKNGHTRRCPAERNTVSGLERNNMDDRGMKPNETVSYHEGGRRYIFTRDQSDQTENQQKATVSNGENIEVLIHLLATLLNEHSKSSTLDRNLDKEQGYDMRQDNDISDDYDDKFSKGTHQVRTDVFNPQNLQPGKATVRKYPNSRNSYSTFRKPSHTALENIGNKHSDIQPGSIKKIIPSHRVITEKTFSRDADNSKWFGKDEHMAQTMNRGERNFNPNQDFSPSSNWPGWFPGHQSSKHPWESKSARINVDTFRYSRRGGRPMKQNVAPITHKHWPRYQPPSDVAFASSPANIPRKPHQDYSRYRQRQNHNSLTASSQLENQYPPFNRHNFEESPEHSLSRHQGRRYPQRHHHISRPETGTFTSFESSARSGPVQRHLGNISPRSKRRFNGGDGSPPFHFEHSYRDPQDLNFPMPSFPQHWQSELSTSSPPHGQVGPSRATIPPIMQYRLNPAFPAQRLQGGSPRLICKSLISLSGGMDQWCSDNCNANFCPSTTCICYSDGQPTLATQFDRWGPRASQETAHTSHKQRYREATTGNYQIFNHNTPEQPGSPDDSEFPFLSPYLVDASQDSIGPTAKLTNTETLSQTASVFEGPRMPRWKNEEFPYHQHQNIFENPIKNPSHTLREEPDIGFNGARLNFKHTAHSLQDAPDILSEHAQPLEARYAPKLRFPTENPSSVLSSTHNPQEHSARKKQSRLTTSKLKKNNNSQNIERTIPYSGLSYEAIQDSLESEDSSSKSTHPGCRAIGAYSGLKHFDDWCSVTCQQTMCPLLLCSCSGYGYK